MGKKGSSRPDRVVRAQGCLLGQLAGDALGSLVEFCRPEEIRRRYPDGVRDLAAGGTWGTLAGQPTDDSELALLLARMLVAEGRYEAAAAFEAYRYWLHSDPFDCGATIASALRGRPNPDSQANGALMRVSPLGIFGAAHPRKVVAAWAHADAALTHPHPVCGQTNALFAAAIAHAVQTGSEPASLYAHIREWAIGDRVDEVLVAVIDRAAWAPPEDYLTLQGWVLVAFGNALWQLLHAPSLEQALVDTVGRGGDTDTNAAVCGALLGAVHGAHAVPARWVEHLVACRPAAGQAGVRRPRPECFWPVDAPDLAVRLVAGGVDRAQG
ncbi:ADP-ribosylglycohydrolase family protein [Acidiferrobacter sp.]|uniref:ADP-ribosylglycohydrolase family protein n=1 Tax=Acidiferrobacter sp. TaxID=1872107 RepID=UPI002611F13D|nr:ADP-ribosylglycohydrolase family protein [Acidiferrobacter sp.]